MDVETFYTTVSTISFVLLGLWWVVVQGREAWHTDLARRQMSYVVSMHFVLPGVMSVLSLVAPDVSWLWRATFSIAGLLGLIGAGFVVRTLRDDHDRPRIVRAIEWVAIPIYAIISVVAIAPELVTGLGVGLTALQVEGIMLALLLFLGVQAAWILMIEPIRGQIRDQIRPQP